MQTGKWEMPNENTKQKTKLVKSNWTMPNVSFEMQNGKLKLGKT